MKKIKKRFKYLEGKDVFMIVQDMMKILMAMVPGESSIHSKYFIKHGNMVFLLPVRLNYNPSGLYMDSDWDAYPWVISDLLIASTCSVIINWICFFFMSIVQQLLLNPIKKDMIIKTKIIFILAKG